MEFTPPRPGTYRLQRIQPTADATLLDPSGRPVRLSAVTTGKITLLTFFYTYCADPIGCPLAYRTLLDVRAGVRPDRRPRAAGPFPERQSGPHHRHPGSHRKLSRDGVRKIPRSNGMS